MTALVILRRIWPYLAAAALLAVLYAWHSHAVSAAYKRGTTKQAAIDRAAFAAAERAATAAQEATIAAVRETSDAISKDVTHDLAAKNDALSRRYAGLRELWLASRADPGITSGGAAVAVSGAASGADGATCEANGWVSWDVAGAAALAADQAISRDDAWRNWATAQAEAWPK